ncbi:MAG TPA: SapC family protein [Gammaproteobacteria bacterium]|nr:SapC family protein [Gammaproteobacteria bacterium]
MDTKGNGRDHETGSSANELEGSTSGTGPRAATSAGAALPLFYRDPTVLQAEVHSAKGIRRDCGYHFARHTHAVPLHLAEFRSALAHYPIVFAPEAGGTPLALLGTQSNQNHFVGEDGRWEPSAYVPAYVRRYPFITARNETDGTQVLCIDLDSDLVVDLEGRQDAEPLFVAGAASEYTKQMQSFCAAFDREIEATKEFISALEAEQTLVDKEIKLGLPDGTNQVMTGFRLVDQQAFDALAESTVVAWHKKGWVSAIHWHWASMDNLVRMITKRT